MSTQSEETQAETQTDVKTELSPFTGLNLIAERKKNKRNGKQKEQKVKQPVPVKPIKLKKRKELKQELVEEVAAVSESRPLKKRKKGSNHTEKERNPADRKIIALLTGYGKNEWLGPYLKDNHGFDLVPSKLRKLSSVKLEDMLGDVEDVLANKSNSALGDGVVRQTMYQLEAMAMMKSRFKVAGTTDRCFENDHWRFLLERVKMKYGVGFGKMDPVAELSLVTFQTASMLHYTNSMATPKTNLEEEIVTDD